MTDTPIVEPATSGTESAQNRSGNVQRQRQHLKQLSDQRRQKVRNIHDGTASNFFGSAWQVITLPWIQCCTRMRCIRHHHQCLARSHRCLVRRLKIMHLRMSAAGMHAMCGGQVQEADAVAKAARWERVKINARAAAQQASQTPADITNDAAEACNGQASCYTRKRASSLDAAGHVNSSQAACKHRSAGLSLPDNDAPKALRSSSQSLDVSPTRHITGEMPKGSAKFAERGQQLAAQQYRRQPGEKPEFTTLTREQKIHRCARTYMACGSQHGACLLAHICSMVSGMVARVVHNGAHAFQRKEVVASCLAHAELFSRNACAWCRPCHAAVSLEAKQYNCVQACGMAPRLCSLEGVTGRPGQCKGVHYAWWLRIHPQSVAAAWLVRCWAMKRLAS